MEREAKIQDALKDLIESATKGARFRGLEITHVERDHPVDNREADLVLYMRGETPFMFIETKRKERGRKPSGLFDPLDVSAVGQVMSYAAIYKRHHKIVVPFVATANPGRIVVFKTPESIEDYINNKAVSLRDYKNAIKPARYRRLLKEQMRLSEQLWLNKEYIQALLGKLAREYVEKRIIKAEPTMALIGRFREFVERVADRCRPLVEVKIKEGPLKAEVMKLGYKLDPKNLPLTVTNLTRMMTYVLMNKLIFYKILEGSYRLPNLVSLDSSSLTKFREELSYYFGRAIEETGDFEPIFSTGVYDQLPIPDDPELMDYINDFIFTLGSVDIVEMGDQMGYLYEELIPPEERHQLGQFYTPPWVCELITKWAIRAPEDVVLDPGVGSGGFLLQAYKVLRAEKVGPSPISIVRGKIHERILDQLYALDINPFPAHLSAMGLAMRNVRVPSTKMNVIHADFFSVQPQQEVLTPYAIRTAAGEVRRKFTIPEMDATIGNPPYTRWTEIAGETRKSIKRQLGKLMQKYKLTPGAVRAEPEIYIHWVIHANNFLKKHGRLGMIISNTWLQTDYGIRFGNFLLDNFRIKGIIDFAAKLFEGALITTCIVLAEKESNETKRLGNEVAFIHIPGKVESADVEELLKAVATGSSQEYAVTLVKQEDLSRDKKWIDVFFRTVDISSHPLMTKLSELYEPLRGNTKWAKWALSHGKRPDLGSSDFSYLSPSKIKGFGLGKWVYPKASLSKAIVYPAITSARQTNFFTFTEKDWKEMRKSDNRCYMFVCHEHREKLPKKIVEYIGWGETECRTRIRSSRKGGRLASETDAAKARAKEQKQFRGWYDLGGVITVPIFAVRQARYKTRFAWCRFPVAMYDALIALTSRRGVSLDEIQTKALLAYLNSSFVQYHIERKGRYIAKGPMGFEVSVAKEMPILDVRKLNKKQLSSLAKLFGELERETRRIGGASHREEIEKLKPKIYKIDRAIAALLDIPVKDVKNVEAQVNLMVERRVGAAKKA
jgi:hypothetical protein